MEFVYAMLAVSLLVLFSGGIGYGTSVSYMMAVLRSGTPDGEKRKQKVATIFKVATASMVVGLIGFVISLAIISNQIC